MPALGLSKSVSACNKLNFCQRCLQNNWNKFGRKIFSPYISSHSYHRNLRTTHNTISSTLKKNNNRDVNNKYFNFAPENLESVDKLRRYSSTGNEPHFPPGSSSSRTKLYYTLKYYIRSPENAETFVSHLKEKERELLLSALNSHANATSNIEQGTENGMVTSRQLQLLFMNNFLPFIGFGFLDNAIMIFAGEYIDVTIGASLGITTMAAAALGNVVSDVAGIGLAGYVEMLCYKLGLPVPALTPEQAEQTSARISSNMGKAFGIIVGCLVGMFPLLFMKELVGENEENNEDDV